MNGKEGFLILLNLAILGIVIAAAVYIFQIGNGNRSVKCTALDKFGDSADIKTGEITFTTVPIRNDGNSFITDTIIWDQSDNKDGTYSYRITVQYSTQTLINHESDGFSLALPSYTYDDGTEYTYTLHDDNPPPDRNRVMADSNKVIGFHKISVPLSKFGFQFYGFPSFDPENTTSFDAFLPDEVTINRGTKFQFAFSQPDSLTSTFDVDVGGWDVKNVTDFDACFLNCRQFNRDLSKWDVSNATWTARMFLFCDKFNSDLSLWRVDNVTSMWGMFMFAGAFDSDLSNWNVSNVEDMLAMFFQNIYNGYDTIQARKVLGDFSKWDVQKVTDMSLMFCGMEIDRGNKINLKNWNLVSTQSTISMFALVHGDGAITGVTSWKFLMPPATSLNMVSMFCGSSARMDDFKDFQLPTNANFGCFFYGSNLASQYWCRNIDKCDDDGCCQFVGILKAILKAWLKQCERRNDPPTITIYHEFEQLESFTVVGILRSKYNWTIEYVESENVNCVYTQVGSTKRVKATLRLTD